jgi:hypothetical protein
VSGLAARPPDVRVGLQLFRKGLETGGVQESNGVQLSRSSEQRLGVLADRLQQPVACPPVLLVDLNQGRVHQSGKQAEHIPRRNSPARADDLRGLQAPATDEHRQPSEDDLLRWREQPVTPVERGLHRLLATRRCPTAADQQPECVIQPLQNLVDPERTHPRRGQFDRQGQALESGTDGRQHRCAARRHSKVRLDRLSALDEQLRRRKPHELVGMHDRTRIGDG